MNQRYKLTEQDIEIISKARADNHNDRAEIRLFALQLRAEGMQAKEIAQIAGVSAPYVSQLVAKYFKGGIEAIICQCVEDFDAKYQVGDVVTFPIVVDNVKTFNTHRIPLSSPSTIQAKSLPTRREAAR